MSPSEKPTLLASVFSDYICPFCYIGDLRLDRLREFYDLRINWCLVEIHPDTPPEGRPVTELGYGSERWRQLMDNLGRLATEEGIRLREHDVSANSHRALLLAEAAKQAGSGVFYKLHRRLFEAFFEEGLDIGDSAVLTGLALDCGVPEGIIRRAWSEPRYEEMLKLYLAAAARHEVRATPTVFFSERHRINGALPFAAFLEAARGGHALQQQSGVNAGEPSGR
ncbi:MAG: DsbA family protein [Gammaproteobacteria bacterium]|jgi:predicted DsbA family dithiol-disulfide isomerase